MNKKQLKAILALHGDNYKTIGEFLGLTSRVVSVKINNMFFSFKEIKKIQQRYNLTAYQISAIFNTSELEKKQRIIKGSFMKNLNHGRKIDENTSSEGD